MEEILALIASGCEKAKYLENHLSTMVGQQHLVLAACKAIASDFNNAAERISWAQAPGSSRLSEEDSFGSEPMAANKGTVDHPEIVLRMMVADTQRTPVENNRLSPSSHALSPSRRPMRRRKEGRRTWTLKVPALSGNLDAMPDDGYTWRKYGQKNILQSRFPRSYYRCTHKHFYGCEAKKQVQRLDDDPYTYDVTYYGDHSCGTSPTSCPIINDAGAFSVNIGASKDDDSRGAMASCSTNERNPHIGTGRETDFSVTDFTDILFDSRGSYILDTLLYSKPQV
ncbi:disease resistance protein RRS1-like [Wolffia australiana]